MNGMAASDRMFKILDAEVEDISKAKENKIYSEVNKDGITFEGKRSDNSKKEDKTFKDVNIN